MGVQLSDVFGETWMAKASSIVGLWILVLSKILPKTVGVRYQRQLAPIMAPTLKDLIWTLLPFIWRSGKITRRLGGKGEDSVDVREGTITSP